MKYSSVFQDHSRNFESNLYVYPVVSRRSKGVSLGINLSMRKECNFDCPYCQIDRTVIEPKEKFIDLNVLEYELLSLIDMVQNESIYDTPKFMNTPMEYRRLNDIALSGDGEPTTSKYFLETSNLVLKILSQKEIQSLKIKPIVITNGSTLNREEVKNVLLRFYEAEGEAWIKLDAGTEDEFKKVAETKIAFSKILDGILEFSKIQSITLQTILYQDESNKETFSISEYCKILNSMKEIGGKFSLIQLYTLARETKVKGLKPVSLERLETVQKQIESCTNINVEIYP
ncbi:MAG: hypothetical protein SFU98_20635 [Leptospiraceae bacterium]|nr:hypothetical protein [Leptospiraceae bacterium]